MHNTSGDNKCIVESRLQLSLGLDCSTMQYSAENLTNNAMGRFHKSVSCRSVRQNSSFLNSPIHEHEFPLVAIELWAIVRNHLFWLGIPSLPGILESACILGALGRSYPCNFNKISDRVNNCHSPKLSNNTLTL